LTESGPEMPQKAAPNAQADADRLETATDQAIAACGGNARDAVKALIVANEFLESEMKQLRATVSNGYARGKFEPRAMRPHGQV
jgi:stage V sporulation protein SpoVS